MSVQKKHLDNLKIRADENQLKIRTEDTPPELPPSFSQDSYLDILAGQVVIINYYEYLLNY